MQLMLVKPGLCIVVATAQYACDRVLKWVCPYDENGDQAFSLSLVLTMSTREDFKDFGQ